MGQGLPLGPGPDVGAEGRLIVAAFGPGPIRYWILKKKKKTQMKTNLSSHIFWLDQDGLNIRGGEEEHYAV